ncbi:hypothetical protein Cylst_4984 [Cylindrospermum stagnale PCC 7417]|uniref:Uncharacterized protein n=1 Tax=Cylindrospermum stagnale PCC 7417 TaxID=56107 RepID=K9X316_9NOST|nr:hypothetical protein Cylst_4984 [Cylindrospermum stagnale PCC 7417]
MLIRVNLTLKPGNDGITTFTQLPTNPEEPHPGFAGAKPPLMRGGVKRLWDNSLSLS